jgi:hypothetical protein
LAILLIGRFPVLTTVFAVLAGASLPFLAVYTVVGVVPGLLMYRFVLELIRQQSSERHSN